MSDFRIARNGQQYGPYSEAGIQAGLSRKKIHPTDLCWTEGIAERKPVSAVFRSKAVPPPILGAPPLSKKPPDSSTPAAHIENVKRMQNDALAADPNKLAAERCYLERLRLIRPASGFGAFQSNGWPEVGSGSKAGQGTTSADRIPDYSIQFSRGPPFIAREALREAGRTQRPHLKPCLRSGSRQTVKGGSIRS